MQRVDAAIRNPGYEVLCSVGLDHRRDEISMLLDDEDAGGWWCWPCLEAAGGGFCTGLTSVQGDYVSTRAARGTLTSLQ